MNLSTQRKIAAKVLKVGKDRVWINPQYIDKVGSALTKQDIRNLIESGVIQKKPEKGTSRARAKKIMNQKKKGLRKGPGSRKGKKYARFNKKRLWILKIRALRAHLIRLKNEGKITPQEYRKLYLMASGGFFRSKKHLDVYIKKKVG